MIAKCRLTTVRLLCPLSGPLDGVSQGKGCLFIQACGMLGAIQARSPPLARAGCTVRCGDWKCGVSKGHVTRRHSKAAGKHSSQQRQ
ncbi:hypothetical protein NDU88_001099 [Pleurodeles waltl]|uniref:Secreted protein n=1 Tax=Pleurodeles waltl TaxID=8319 RepID=A0AAV7WKT8_PLEWA|nr:hypothetical protein NDU88_001099 [Pleurodeles waltl]